MKKTLCLAILLGGIGIQPAHAGGCYDIGQGPIMACYEGNREVIVRQPFTYKGDAYNYYGRKKGGYCYRNRYGNKRCMQEWRVKSLECFDTGRGIVCN